MSAIKYNNKSGIGQAGIKFRMAMYIKKNKMIVRFT